MASTPRQRVLRDFVNTLAIVGLLGGASAQRPSLRASTTSQKSNAERTAAGDAAAKPGKKARGLTVESFSPRGPVTPGAVISVTFSDDIVTSDALDDGDTPKAVFAFEPSIDGTLQWESPRQVRFVPTRPLKQATEYVVRVNPLLRSKDGEALKETVEYRFQTPPLTLKSAAQESFYPDGRVSLRLNFTDTVNPQDLQKYLGLSAGNQALKWRLLSDVATAAPTVVTIDPMTTDSLKLMLEPGLRGVSGPLGLRNRVEQRVKLDFTLVATQMKGSWDNGKPMLSIKFSSPPYVAMAEKYISIDPPAKVTFGEDDGELKIYGDLEAEKRYKVTIKKGFRSNQQKIMLEPVTLTAWMPAMTPFLEVPEGYGYLSTKGRMKVRVRTAAMNRVNVTARRVFDSNLTQQAQRDGWDGVQYLGKKIGSKVIDLKVEPNKPQITELDLRDMLGANATGIYGLEIRGETSSTETGDNSNYSWRQPYTEHAVINLSNLGLVAKVAPQEVMVFVAGLDSAQPVAGVNVSLYSNRHQLLGEGVTDASGMTLIKGLADKDPDAEPKTIVAQASDKSEISLLDLQDTLSNLDQFSSTGRDYLHSGYEAFVTPERGAYRPGETIHVTGFIRGKDAAPPDTPFPVEVVLERPDGKKMTPEVKTPTDTGLLNFDLQVPAYAPTGYYNVEVRMPGTGNGEGDEDEDY